MEGDDDQDYDNYGQETEQKKQKNEVEKIEMTLDDVIDDDDKESLLGLSKNPKPTGSLQNIFQAKESNDKGLADMETGSEVYMSELLVFHLSYNLYYRLDLIWRTLMRLRK